MPTPSRRIVLLGASNLTRALPTIVETVRQMYDEPLEIMAALGHGRSYGQDSWFWARKISGIFQCSLWHDLNERPKLPTVALITDIGNDLAYGVPVEQVQMWVEGCLERLAEEDARVVVTRLPIESIERIGAWRFRFFRTVLFPRARFTLKEIVERARTVDAWAESLGSRKNVSVKPVSKAWYGIDVIHVRRRMFATVWPEMLAAWGEEARDDVRPRASVARWAQMATMSPAEHRIFGVRRLRNQPSGRFRDGTTLSLY